MLQIHSDSHRLIYKVGCGKMSLHKDSCWGYKNFFQHSAWLWTGGEDNNRPRTRICEWGTVMDLKQFIFPYRIFVIESYCIFQGNLHTLIFLQVNRGVFETLGVKHSITSAYHPQANGQDEQTNRNIKEALAKYCGEGQNDWDAHITIADVFIQHWTEAQKRVNCYNVFLDKYWHFYCSINILNCWRDILPTC